MSAGPLPNTLTRYTTACSRDETGMLANERRQANRPASSREPVGLCQIKPLPAYLGVELQHDLKWNTPTEKNCYKRVTKTWNGQESPESCQHKVP